MALYPKVGGLTLPSIHAGLWQPGDSREKDPSEKRGAVFTKDRRVFVFLDCLVWFSLYVIVGGGKEIPGKESADLRSMEGFSRIFSKQY